MLRIILLLTIAFNYIQAGNTTTCSNFQANFDLNKVKGTWYVVAIVPEAQFPDKQKVPCYKVDFTEAEENGLRWLLNKTLAAPPLAHAIDLLDQSKGMVIRQRYNSDHAFDVWSKSIQGFKGCFQQVFSLNTDLTDITDRPSEFAIPPRHRPGDWPPKRLNIPVSVSVKRALSTDTRMQLHLIDTESGPFLLQMLWGHLITGVIYRKEQSIVPEKLKPVSELLVKLRGPQRAPKLCDKRLKD